MLVIGRNEASVKGLMERVLRKLGEFLTCETRLEPADYIVVLNGSPYDRVREAVDLYKEGLGEKILIPRSYSPCGYEMIRNLGITLLNDCEINLEVLRKYNIPEDDIKVTSDMSFGTYEEALSVRSYLNGGKISSLTLVTSHYHSRRAYSVFKKVLGNKKIKIMCRPTRYDHIDMNGWWKIGWQRKWILWEYSKLIYYYLRY